MYVCSEGSQCTCYINVNVLIKSNPQTDRERQRDGSIVAVPSSREKQQGAEMECCLLPTQQEASRCVGLLPLVT